MYFRASDKHVLELAPEYLDTPTCGGFKADVGNEQSGRLNFSVLAKRVLELVNGYLNTPILSSSALMSYLRLLVVL